MSGSIVLLGGPDSGKTNYVGRVWPALDEGKGSLHAAEQPEDIRFVLDVTDHLNSGSFAPRSEHADDRRDFEVVVAAQKGGEKTTIVIPDISGELWLNAAEHGEVSAGLMEEMQSASGALLFVRVNSEADVRPLNWVTSKNLLAKLGNEDDQGLPTQVMVCELLRFLEDTLSERPDGAPPRLSVVVSAWDLVDPEKFTEGPKAWLEREYPLIAGRLNDIDLIDLRIFGLSVVGGDLKVDESCRDDVQENGLDGRGWIAVEGDDGVWRKDADLTLPIAWAVGN
ncbi:TRAFAC clade GTPase domain-containing protein [Sphingomonas prati]|uniref:Double-GTPase 1 domain-containing protein n=1 Tax=Sphingomonas prati TaxID=1843237 RepID=A0A7W9F304_9SPHN|nr:hypothetical protein [Sphingomonas prati]MBB5730982.1 hypothetical protein [Sphingomonas prati]GGE98206.1 hypothetical protein GCM10011404_34210 [Sphingomonas prati]